MTDKDEVAAVKPCPFCKSNHTILSNTGVHWVNCLDCGCEGPVCDTEEDTIDAWNTRASAAPGEPCAVKVKPLRWLHTSVFGSVKWRGMSEAFGEVGTFNDAALSNEHVEEKKAAIQADYEQRIRSALITTPQPAAGWDEAISAAIVAVTEMRDKWSSPTGDKYSCGLWDQSQRIIGKLETLRREAPAPAEGVEFKSAKAAVARELRPLKDAVYALAEKRASPDTAEARKGIVPLADHAAIGMMLVEKVPHPVYAAIVTITAHCAALQLDPSPDRVFDIGGCISQECMTLARAICPSKELEDAGKAVRDIRNELDRTRAECASWKEQFESASAAAAEYSEFWEKHSSDFDQFDNYVPHSQIDGDLRAAKAEIERLKAVSSPPAEARLREALDLETIQTLLDLLNPLHGSLDEQTYDDKLRENFDAPADAEYGVNITARMERDLTQAVLILEDRKRQALSPPSGGDEATKSEGGYTLEAETHRADANARTCKGFASALERIRNGEPNAPQIALDALRMPWDVNGPLSDPTAGRREIMTVANQIIGQIEERFPNWRSYRDLIDCIDCTLHDLRSRTDKS